MIHFSYRQKVQPAFAFKMFLLQLVPVLVVLALSIHTYFEYEIKDIDSEVSEILDYIDFSKNVNGTLNSSSIPSDLDKHLKTDNIHAFIYNDRNTLLNNEDTEGQKILNDFLSKDAVGISPVWLLHGHVYLIKEVPLINSVRNSWGSIIFLKQTMLLEYLMSKIGLILVPYLLISFILIWLISISLVNSILRPLHKLTSQLATMNNISDLATLETPPETPKELALLVDTQNNLISRINDYNNERDHLFKSLAHGIKSPLTVINNTAELVVKGLIEPLKGMDSIKSEVVNITGLVNYYITTSRVNTASIKLKEIDLESVVSNLLKKNEPVLKNKDLKVNFSVLDELKIISDEEMIYELLDNVFSNMLNHSPSGTDLDITSFVEGNCTTLVFSNDISKDKRTRTGYGKKIIDNIVTKLKIDYEAKETSNKYSVTIRFRNEQ